MTFSYNSDIDALFCGFNQTIETNDAIETNKKIKNIFDKNNDGKLDAGELGNIWSKLKSAAAPNNPYELDETEANSFINENLPDMDIKASDLMTFFNSLCQQIREVGQKINPSVRKNENQEVEDIVNTLMRFCSTNSYATKTNNNMINKALEKINSENIMDVLTLYDNKTNGRSLIYDLAIMNSGQNQYDGKYDPQNDTKENRKIKGNMILENILHPLSEAIDKYGLSSEYSKLSRLLCDTFGDSKPLFEKDVINAENEIYRVFINKNKSSPYIINHFSPDYNVRVKDDVYEIKKLETGETAILDVNKLTRKLPPKAAIYTSMIVSQLPSAVLMDLAIEVDTLNIEDIVDRAAAGYYNSRNDDITIDSNQFTEYLKEILVHELGHAVDYHGKDNKSSILANPEFQKAFEEEMAAYLKDGQPKCKGADSVQVIESGSSNYCTTNEREMFAECYTYVMLGKCNSKNTIEKYFQKTLAVVKKHIEDIRKLPKSERHPG